jgi:hypothetical protein
MNVLGMFQSMVVVTGAGTQLQRPPPAVPRTVRVREHWDLARRSSGGVTPAQHQIRFWPLPLLVFPA